MNAFAYIQDTQVTATPTGSVTLHGGYGTDLFSTGSGASVSDMMSGEGVEFFTTGSVATLGSMIEGEATGLYTTSC